MQKLRFNFFFLVLLMAIPMVVHCQTEKESREDQVKAAYLYNFTKFVYWEPLSDNRKPAPFIIGLVGAGEIASLLEDYIKSSPSASGVAVKRFQASDPGLKDCQMVYIDHSQKVKLRNILTHIGYNKILTVGDVDGFAKQGGMIGFYEEDGRIKIEINLSSVIGSGLEVSAKLIEIARIIK